MDSVPLWLLRQLNLYEHNKQQKLISSFCKDLGSAVTHLLPRLLIALQA